MVPILCSAKKSSPGWQGDRMAVLRADGKRKVKYSKICKLLLRYIENFCKMTNKKVKKSAGGQHTASL